MSQHRSLTLSSHLQRVSEVALFVFVMALPISISIMQAAYILAVAAWLLSLYLQPNRQPVHFPLIVPMCGFALVSVLATIMAINPYESLIELRNILEVTVFYLTVNTVRSEEHATVLTYTLIAAVTMMALYGIAQAIASGMSIRVTGSTGYMTLGAHLMLASSLTLAQLLFHRTTRHTRWLIPALLVLLMALLLTQTRNAWLGFIVASLVLLGTRHKLLPLVLPLLIICAFLMAPSAAKDRIRSVVNLQDVTFQERLSMWRSGWRIIQDYPWLGTGMGAMKQTYQRYREPNSPIAPHRRLGHLHSNVVQVTAERGLIGLAGWLSIWVVFFYQAWYIYRGLPPSSDRAKALVVGSGAGVAGFLTAGVFEHNFGDAETITMVYFLMALPFLTQQPVPLISPSDHS